MHFILDLPHSQKPFSQNISTKKPATLVVGVEFAITLGTSVENRTSFIRTSQLHISESHLGVGALRACCGCHSPSLAVFSRQDLNL
jgi:hypothetical protein